MLRRTCTPQPSSEGFIQKSKLNMHVLLFSVVFIASDTYQLHLVMQKTNTALLSTEDIGFLQLSVPGLPHQLLAKGSFISEGPCSTPGSFPRLWPSHLTATARLSSCSAFLALWLGDFSGGCCFLSRVGTDLRAEGGLWGINKLRVGL